MSNGYLLDSSAVLALLGNEPGADRVVPLLPDSAITTINLAEVVKKLRERSVSVEEVREIIDELQIPLEHGPLDHVQAIELGDFAALGRPAGLSMGDAVCLTVAARSGRTAVTTDRKWKDLPATISTAKILLVR